MNKPIVVLGRCLLLLTFFFTPLVTLRPGGAATFGDIFLVLSALTAVLLLIVQGRRPELPRWLWGGTALLAASVLLTVVFPPSSVLQLTETYYPTPYTSSLATGIRLLASVFVLPLTVGVLADRGSTVRLAVWAWIGAVTLSCLVAVLDGVLGTGLQKALADNPEEVGNYLRAIPPRFVGLGVHPTSFSVIAVMVLPFLFTAMKTPKRFLAISPALLIIFVAVVFSASRVGYLGAFAVAVLSLWLDPRLRRLVLKPDLRTWGPLAVIAVVTLLALFNGPPAYHQEDAATKGSDNPAARLQPDSITAEGSNNIRMEFAEKSVEFIQDRPFTGYGFEWIESAHSIYLQLLVAGGVLALVGFLWLYLGYLRRGWDLRGRLPEDLDAVRIAAVISLGSYLVMGLVQPDLLDRYLYLPAGLILALSALSVRGRRDEGAEAGPTVEPKLRSGAQPISQ